MDYITRHEGYQYFSLISATTFLLPQFYSGYRSGSLKDVSAASMWLVFFGGIFWSIYMYEEMMYEFAAATLFVTINAFALLLMKFRYYQQRVNSHFTSFDIPPGPPTFRIENPSE
jgi:uncharacterized protein with PQ loop repeat